MAGCDSSGGEDPELERFRARLEERPIGRYTLVDFSLDYPGASVVAVCSVPNGRDAD